MRVGISLSSSLVSDNPSTAARWMIERASAADRAGLDSLSVGDNHALGSPYYQNTPMLGRLLAEWGPRPAGCLFLLPLWHPVLVAEHIATLAALVDDVFIMQTGVGQGHSKFAAMNADHGTRGVVLEEGVRVVKALLAGEDVESDLVGGPVRLGLRPEQPIQWWIGGGPSPKALDRAARIGDAWYAGPSLDIGSAAAQLDQYLSACDLHGRPARPILRKDVIVLSAPGEAHRLGQGILDGGYRGLTGDHVLMGTPDEVADRLRPYAEMGFTDVICRCMTVSQSQALETIELLSEVRALLASSDP